METNNQPKKRISNWAKNSITARMLMVGILTVILLIPMSFIKSLIHERMNRQQEVVNEINQKWGKEVLLYGPILKVPYKINHVKEIYDEETKKKKMETYTSISYAYFFPKKLDIKSTINPEEKQRGIYKTAVYKSTIDISGSFTKPNFSEREIKEEDILWNKAKLIIETSNLKGVNSLVEIQLNKNKYSFESKYEQKITSNYNKNNVLDLHKLESKFLKEEDLPNENDVVFNLNININGSKQIRFIPVGKETNVHIKSDWKTANFLGEYLPQNSDKISDNGFNAKWKVLDINRPFSQESFNGIPDLKAYAFGVNFMIPVDEYQKSEHWLNFFSLLFNTNYE